MNGTEACVQQIESRSDAWTSRSIVRYEYNAPTACDDSIIQEYAVEVWVNGTLNRSITASPWNLVELAIGELCLDGCITSRADVASCVYDESRGRVDVQTVHKTDALGQEGRLGAHAGEETVDVSRVFPRPGRCAITPPRVSQLISLLEKGSELFHRTGGVHSAVLVSDAGVEAWFEDIGRHSAVDKVVGWCLLQDKDPSEMVMVFSGRVPYEIIAKMGFLGVPCIISPGAPTSASIDFAEQHDITLIGFAKEHTFNVYTHSERIKG